MPWWQIAGVVVGGVVAVNVALAALLARKYRADRRLAEQEVLPWDVEEDMADVKWTWPDGREGNGAHA